ncbi:MAG TPA: hypothetical protein VGD27_14075 [Longimicrobiales bacterium]
MDSSAIPVFLAGPFPVLHTARVLAEVDEVELDVGLIIEGQPTILASTRFSLDDSWERIRIALASGDARLGVAGLPHVEENLIGEDVTYPSAYIGLECANGERLVLAHIRGLDESQRSEVYAREVIGSLLDGLSPDELGETIDD